MIQGSFRPSLAAAALAAFVSLTAFGAVLASTSVRPDVEATKKELLKLRDEADSALVSKLADEATRPAMEALLEVYDGMSSIWMRREVVRALARFDRVEDSFQPALDKVMNVATTATEPELRAAALESLGKAAQHGKTFLALIVDSAAADDIRVEAMRLHTKLGDASDASWYKGLYARTPKDAADTKRDKPKRPKKGEEEVKELLIPRLPEVRRLAMEALLPTLEDSDLISDFREDPSLTIKSVALTELHKRNNAVAGEFARGLLERVDTNASMRAFCAELVYKIEGVKVADEFIDLAQKGVDQTQQVLRDKLADLLADMKDEKVDKKLLALVGKGKPHERAFALRATRKINDPKLMEKVRKGLKDKEPELLYATLGAIAARKDREAIGEVEKLLEKPKDAALTEALLETLSALHEGDNEWVARLQQFADSPELTVRNSAIYELGRLGRRNLHEFFVKKLADENWSTRYAAARALEALRTSESIGALITRLPQESGRVEILFTDMLWRLTGKPFGKRASAWTAWWEGEGAGFQPIDAKELGTLQLEADERRLRQVSSVSEFFGIKIESQRVIFILDVSGSMAWSLRPRYQGEQGEARIDVAKRELLKAIEGLDPKALFNIVTFSGGMERWKAEGIAQTTPDARAEALEYVRRLGADGGTNIYGALQMAFEDPDVDTIVMLSDGEPSVGDIIDAGAIRQAVLEWNDTRGVKIDTVALGDSLQLMKWIAEDNGGKYVEYN